MEEREAGVAGTDRNVDTPPSVFLETELEIHSRVSDRCRLESTGVT
jgi:hypothetical protein